VPTERWFRIRNISVDDTSWTPLIAPASFQCFELYNASSSNVKVRTDDTMPESEMTLNNGSSYAVIREGVTAPPRIIEGDTVVFCQMATAGQTGTVVCFFT
jgi:hypothetical protein